MMHVAQDVSKLKLFTYKLILFVDNYVSITSCTTCNELLEHSTSLVIYFVLTGNTNHQHYNNYIKHYNNFGERRDIITRKTADGMTFFKWYDNWYVYSLSIVHTNEAVEVITKTMRVVTKSKGCHWNEWSKPCTYAHSGTGNLL